MSETAIGTTNFSLEQVKERKEQFFNAVHTIGYLLQGRYMEGIAVDGSLLLTLDVPEGFCIAVARKSGTPFTATEKNISDDNRTDHYASFGGNKIQELGSFNKDNPYLATRLEANLVGIKTGFDYVTFESSEHGGVDSKVSFGGYYLKKLNIEPQLLPSSETV